MKRLALALAALALCAASLAQEKAPAEPPKPSKDAAAAAATTTVAVLETELGRIVIEFFPEKAPRHVKNFQNLCKTGFYTGTKFHRTVPGFMVQGGDPNTKSDDQSKWGTGGVTGADGVEKTLPAEFNDTPHVRGVVSMARSSDPNSASSQFFICVADARFLDRQYTAFGRVVEGMEVVDKIVGAPAVMAGESVPSRPVKPVVIKKATLEKRAVAPPAAPAPPAGK